MTSSSATKITESAVADAVSDHGWRGGARALALRAAPIALVCTASLAVMAPAQAVGGYHTSASSVRVRAGATTQSAQVNLINNAGTGIDIACQTGGENVTVAGFGTSPVWDKINVYNGYISDLFVQETPYAQFDSRIPRCDQPNPNPGPPAATWGRTTPRNLGVWGQCVWYALERFHQATGVYPLGYGDAWNFANSTGANGWTVSNTPRVRSVAVFQPGANGAGSYGHVAWVEQVSGNQIQVAEMNYGYGNRVGKESRRWLIPTSNVRYVYAP
jgi:surface antigen